MPPKEEKKKLTKKEKEAIKKVELERLAEEQRLADIAEAERLEKERLRLAHEAKLAAELAARVALELEKRREVEDAENAPLREELQRKLRDEERTRANGAEWAHYIGCHLLPDAQSEAAVNMFIAEWAEAPAAQLEQAMEDCDRAATLLQQIADAHLIALRKPAVDAAALWHPAALSALGALSTLKLDYVTAETLANSEERATSRNELQLAAQTASLKYALWVNLARNPRVKSVEFGEVGLTIVELPKALPVASVAVGLRQLRTEHAAPSFGKPSLFQTLGGVTIVDLLTLPPPPKRVKGWTLRHASTAQPAVTRMAYPIPPVGGESAAAAAAAAAAAPPLRLMLTLPSDVVVADKMVRVGWWDEDSGQWSLDGVSEIRYDSEVRSLSFLTVHLCSLAVLQHTYAELPYKRWCLTPTGPSSSVLAVQTVRYLAVFDLTAEGCMLVEPVLAELSKLLGKRMPPPILLGKLRESGINLCPHDRDAPPLHANLTPKTAQLEEEALAEILLLSQTCRIADSKWNASRTADTVVVRVSPNLPTDEDDDVLLPSGAKVAVDHFAGMAQSDAWQTLLYAHREAAILHSSEGDAALALDVHGKEQLARGEVAHSSVINCFKERHPELLPALTQASAYYQSELRQLFAQMRLLSFTLGAV